LSITASPGGSTITFSYTTQALRVDRRRAFERRGFAEVDRCGTADGRAGEETIDLLDNAGDLPRSAAI